MQRVTAYLKRVFHAMRKGGNEPMATLALTKCGEFPLYSTPLSLTPTLTLRFSPNIHKPTLPLSYSNFPLHK